MQHIQLDTVFFDSLDTFKVLDSLTIAETGQGPLKTPKTIWQILNHLINWQEYQLAKLKNIAPKDDISEEESWIAQENANSPQELERAVYLFESQLKEIKEEINKLTFINPKLTLKLKIIQDISVHLSFHIGEMILMRRLTGNYPLPDLMKNFLN